MRDGLAIHDDRGALVVWNKAAADITGWDQERASQLMPADLTDGLVDVGDGTWVEVKRVPMDSGGRPVIATLFTDARHQVSLRDAYARLNELVTTDALTGLPNRLLADDRLRLSVALAERDGRSVALLYLDLDRFKLINDTLGHQTGDALLKQVAERLKSSVRESDTAARVGGDEFIVILHTVTHPEDTTTVAMKIIDTMRPRFVVEGHEIYLGCSVGIALFPDHGPDTDALLRHADVAMYRAKADGGNSYRLYAPVMAESNRGRLQLAADLRRALDRSELEVHYQPQIDIDDGSLVAAEALVRWRHPERGLITPDRFLPMAEDDGSIVDIDAHVLSAACQQVVEWEDAGMYLPMVSVNFSARTLATGTVVPMVHGILERFGLAANRLEVEVSEHVVADQATEASAQLEELRALGVKVANRRFRHWVLIARSLAPLPDRHDQARQKFRDRADRPTGARRHRCVEGRRVHGGRPWHAVRRRGRRDNRPATIAPVPAMPRRAGVPVQPARSCTRAR